MRTASVRARSWVALAALLASGCVLPDGPDSSRIFESHWRLPDTVIDGRETLVASWTVPSRVKLADRLLQVSGRIDAGPEADLPFEVVVRVKILALATGKVRKKYRLIVERSPDDGFRRSKKFPRVVAGESMVNVTVEPVGARLPAGAEVSMCLDLVKKRKDLEEFASCAVGDAEATLSGIQVSVFSGSCAVSGCHDSVTAEQGLVLEGGLSFANLINVSATQSPGDRRVRPGDPDRSYLVRKLRGTNNIGGRMPLGGPFLSDEEVAGVVEWIENGARDN